MKLRLFSVFIALVVLLSTVAGSVSAYGMSTPQVPPTPPAPHGGSPQAATSHSVSAGVSASAESPKQKGMSYAAWEAGIYSQPAADQSLRNLRATGADWISLIVTQYQDTISSTVIYSTTATPTDADLTHAIAQAHSLGFKVMLKPHVDLANDLAHWRGQIGQDFADADWTNWFAAYAGFIDHYAQLAQTNGADQFCVGTELSTPQADDSRWRSVIAGVRSLYSGPITYAANWGDETSLTWWDAVDYIGVDAYYPLTSQNDPTVAELNAAWAPHVTALANLAAGQGKSILFTEIGYRSQIGANQHPWDYQSGGAVDLQEQANAYQAVFESVFHQPWFAGVFWWSWDATAPQGGPCDTGYSPYNKPAEDVLRAGYGGLPRSSPSSPQPDDNHVLNVYQDQLATGWDDWSWDAAVDLASPDPVYSGTQAISVTAQAWGALALHTAGLNTQPYYWLEFYIDEPALEQPIRVFFDDEYTATLVDICQYIDGPAQPNSWMRVRVPLSDLSGSNHLIQQVAIKNYSGQVAQFHVDEVRFIGATWSVFLPAVVGGH